MNPDWWQIDCTLNNGLEISKRGGNTQPLITRSAECGNLTRVTSSHLTAPARVRFRAVYCTSQRAKPQKLTHSWLTETPRVILPLSRHRVRARNSRRGSASQNITDSFKEILLLLITLNRLRLFITGQQNYLKNPLMSFQTKH